MKSGYLRDDNMKDELVSELRQLADSGGKDVIQIADLLNRAAEAIESKLVFDLNDAMDLKPHKVSCRITSDSLGIYLRPRGYGDCDSIDGDGCPVMVEFFDGEMRVVIWDDINSDEPQIISLEGAREDAREDDEDNDNP